MKAPNGDKEFTLFSKWAKVNGGTFFNFMNILSKLEIVQLPARKNKKSKENNFDHQIISTFHKLT